jgi:hypothetical protein
VVVDDASIRRRKMFNFAHQASDVYADLRCATQTGAA